MDKCGEPVDDPQEGDCCVIEKDDECIKGKYIQTGHYTVNGKTTPILSCESKSSNNTSWWWSIIFIVLMILAFYLSWSCNTSMYKDIGVVSKVIKAIFAALFAPIYLIIYFFIWQGPCSKSKNLV